MRIIQKFITTIVAVLFAALPTLGSAQQQGDIIFLVDESGSVEPIQGSLETNIINIANQLDVAGIDWRIGVGGFGAGSAFGNPRVVQQFTTNVSDVQAAVAALDDNGGTEYGLSAISTGLANDVAPYGGIREDAGLCVVLLTNEDSDVVAGSTAVQERADALAALQAVGAGFIGVVDADASGTWDNSTVTEDYINLVNAGAMGVPGAIFDIDDYVNMPDAANMAIIDTCINTILAPVNYALDIKPTSCPNPIKMKGNGVLPVAILGRDGADVADIDVDSLTLEGCPVIRHNYEDVATPYDGGFGDPLSERNCTRQAVDGYTDLTLKFSKRCVYRATGINGNREVRLLTLMGQTTNGTAIEIQDVVRLMK